MSKIYDLAMAAYAGAAKVAALRNPKAGLMVRGRGETFERLRRAIHPDDHPVWFHAASLGEFEQARPVIERIKEAWPERKIVVSFFSPSGYEVRKNYPLADAVVYLPADTPGQMERFVGAVNPKVAVFVKYEIWRNALETLHRHHVPTLLISAVFRPGQLFFKPWGRFYLKWLEWFERIFVQDSSSLKLLEGAGIRKAEIAGDTRFDRVLAIKEQGREIPEARLFTEGERKVLAAGSSWEADEENYADWVAAHPEVKVILAPHEFNPARLKKLKERFGGPLRVVLFSEVAGRTEDPDIAERLREAQVLVVDCFGLLSSLYAYADAAYVGGGFGAGLHNINEAAVYDIPVVFGPNNRKFLEAHALRECGGGFEVKGKEEAERTLDRLFSQDAFRKESGARAGDYIRKSAGATERIFTHLRELLGK